jgi:hypothetical protein
VHEVGCTVYGVAYEGWGGGERVAGFVCFLQ